MVRFCKKLLLWTLLLLALPLEAQLESHEIAMVQVVTQASHAADCLAPVAVNKIDGEKRAVPAQGFLIEAGLHTINGRAKLDISSCPFKDDDLRISPAPELEVNFESGKIYYIAYYHGSDNTEDWQLVVWNIEQADAPDENSQPLQ